MTLLRVCDRPGCDLPPVRVNMESDVPQGFVELYENRQFGRPLWTVFMHLTCAITYLQEIAGETDEEVRKAKRDAIHQQAYGQPGMAEAIFPENVIRGSLPKHPGEVPPPTSRVTLDKDRP